jgi:hypothetical protein
MYHQINVRTFRRLALLLFDQDVWYFVIVLTVCVHVRVSYLDR